ncbi:MAG: site-2 protease family protein [Candidatus Colwellbacteria bacterium]|nr:site-2 protease family protein [Candidatus Colwellbacteria bacterium]
MENAIGFLFQAAILIFSVVIHEVSHGYAALRLGDKTAYYEGRLTLNPLKHVDPFGSVLLPLITYFAGGIIFGWARPVPYNPYNLRNQKWGPAIVGATGPAANIGLALVFGLSFRFLPAFSNALSGGSFFFNFFTVVSLITLLNLALAVFNLVPIPPLDGSKVLFALLPYHWRHVQDFLEQYGFFLLIIFILFFIQWLLPVVLFLFRAITGTMPLL